MILNPSSYNFRLWYYNMTNSECLNILIKKSSNFMTVNLFTCTCRKMYYTFVSITQLIISKPDSFIFTWHGNRSNRQYNPAHFLCCNLVQLTPLWYDVIFTINLLKFGCYDILNVSTLSHLMFPFFYLQCTCTQLFFVIKVLRLRLCKIVFCLLFFIHTDLGTADLYNY